MGDCCREYEAYAEKFRQLLSAVKEAIIVKQLLV
jgi:hypothetical protein